MTLKKNLAQVVMLISVLLTGCAQKVPDVGISPQYLNNYLEIQPTPNINEFRFNEIIAFNIKARTNVEVKVTFSSIRIFMFDEEVSDWREIGKIKDEYPFLGSSLVGDNVHSVYISSDVPGVVLSKSCMDNHCKKTEIFGVAPDVPNQGKPVDVLVFVSGNVYENGVVMDQEVGAYVIFTLRP